MASVDTRQGRYYPWSGGNYVSVTTVISDGIPKPGLARWMAKKVAEVAGRERESIAGRSEQDAIKYLLASLTSSANAGEAASTGSRVHAICEDYAKSGTFPDALDEDVAPFIEQYKRFILDWNPEYVESEATVYSRLYGYAGTLDAIARIDGRTYILDIKTGKGVWPEVALQLAAYRHADFIGRPDGREDPIPDCDGALVLHLRPDAYELLPVSADSAVHDTFLSALDIHRWIRYDAKAIVGTAKER